ncbi:hypothetical protein GCM10007857_85890 [Bradyrhizobium iriomotense]|uniref:Uncharacterized protein n=1 Tax=Bradyrhizobium iriomotense TaxID=441950 RepID=A0ABQ6BDD8_9BRAD|nr:hypothetical protein GCM10007857_85890 [Bradyrhizobium iriomotense]
MRFNIGCPLETDRFGPTAEPKTVSPPRSIDDKYINIARIETMLR